MLSCALQGVCVHIGEPVEPCHVISLHLCRLVRALLGETAISKSKLEHGCPLTVLGLCVHSCISGVIMKPSPDKVKKWLAKIRLATESGNMSPGDASKLAGARAAELRDQLHMVCCFAEVLSIGLRSIASINLGERFLFLCTNTRRDGSPS